MDTYEAYLERWRTKFGDSSRQENYKRRKVFRLNEAQWGYHESSRSRIEHYRELEEKFDGKQTIDALEELVYHEIMLLL
jgi:hypothetical protein